ncbi:hypothetical protein CPC08DRAFT_650220, partial [Agrocybe pediades]
MRYHETYDPLADRDPLEEFGAVGGLLPDRPAEEAMMLRDIVIRWSYPHLMCLWESLPQGVNSFLKARVTITELIAYNLPNDTTSYGLPKERLNEFAQIILALSQILATFAEFFYRGKKSSFTVDVNFSLLRLLAWHAKPTEIALTVPLLQRRCEIAVIHIKKYFNKIRSIFTDDERAESVASYNSSTPSERSRLARLSPRSVLIHLAARDDY